VPDSNAYRHGALSIAIGDDVRQDLRDLKQVTGISETEIVRRAIREYGRQRARNIKPTSAAAVRLLKRYTNQED